MADLETAEPGVEAAETDENLAQEGQEPGQEGQEAPEKRTPWFQKRINELTAARRAEEAAKLQLQRENEALKALLPKADPANPAAPATADFDRAVSERAAAMRRVEEINAASNAAFEKGVEAYPGKFQGAVTNLQAAGVLSAENTTFLEAALATEAPERVLYELGQNPEEAMRLAALAPAKLAVELDRMARKAAEVAVSETPPPITPLAGGRAAKAFDPADVKGTDMKTWLKEREKQVAERRR